MIVLKINIHSVYFKLLTSTNYSFVQAELLNFLSRLKKIKFAFKIKYFQ
jgi:hypothetical protein